MKRSKNSSKPTNKSSSTLQPVFRALLRPPGFGIPSFSTSRSLTSGAMEGYLGALSGLETLDAPLKAVSDSYQATWEKSFALLKTVKVVVLGVPSDTGAGIRRGAMVGPLGLREVLFRQPEFLHWLRSGQVLDLGDLFANPHLLHDDMLSASQIKRSQKEMYADAPPSLRSKLPVSPLSQMKLILTELIRTRPDLRFFVIGGDHSVAWPMSEVLNKRYPSDLAIVQPDAHTDLLESRLGVQYCFGTWSFHALKLLKKKGRLVQIGIRASRFDQVHWEKLGVKQYWAKNVNDRTIEEMMAHLKKTGARKIYFSNDIDGTDSSEISATGTPEKGGLSSQLVFRLIERLSQEFELVGADIMEYAPDLAPNEQALESNSKLVCAYAMRTLKGLLES